MYSKCVYRDQLELLCSGTKMLFKNEQYFCITISSLQFWDTYKLKGPIVYYKLLEYTLLTDNVIN